MPFMKLASPDHARRSLLLGALLTGCRAHESLPQVGYTLLDGVASSTDALRGRVVFVNFWATSCAVCVAEMPRLVALHRKFMARGFETLAVAMQYDAPARVADYATSRQLPFGVAIDNTGTIARAFGNVQATPTSFLADRRGLIVRRWVGEPDFDTLHTLVDTLLSPA